MVMLTTHRRAIFATYDDGFLEGGKIVPMREWKVYVEYDRGVKGV